MSRLPILTPETASEAARPFLENARQASGFLPNLLGVLANAPAALETYITVSGLNAKTSLTLAEREVVQLVAATTHGCDFCVAGHTAVATHKAKLEPATIAALRSSAKLPEPKLEALAAFARAVIARRGAVTDAELQRFVAAGYTSAQALEVVLGVSLATLCNFANVLAQTPLNPELAAYRWGPAHG
ncbi:carboxymuconolactone decarboxylase family protein [Pseudomonas oryzihabitans]|uniref:carboxymuconolactone decarboxylase family protein n=1 Tax=Pseudomonas oryzihabitans TaxID=47885 RepID=UPI00135DEEB7|nr:carboxymuconolactone decarboxylase family protein [Pseudomonas oryzihabitans]MXS18347.1 carboxymuconolactone decarboxylase family protein [Pseudomonas oryzihabitans]